MPTPANNDRWDPLGLAIELDHRATLHPLGFPLELASNDRRVIEIAAHAFAWSSGTRVASPTILKIIVSQQGAPSPPPRFRAHGQDLSIAADDRHHGAFRLDQGSGACWVSAATVADARRFRRLYLESVVYQLLSHRFLTPVHAACVERHGRGVLLCGPSGSGKSVLALQLARRSWRFVSDDVSYLLRDDPTALLGRPHRLRLKPGVESLLPETRDLIAVDDPEDGPVYEPTARQLDLPTSEACRHAALVFLERGQPPNLTPIAKAEALERLLTDLPLADPATSQAQLATLEAALEKGAYRLQYQTAEDAAATLAAM